MAIVGLKMVRTAQIDPTTQKIISKETSVLDTDILEIDNRYLGSKTANITGLEGTTTKIWGNNTQQDQSTGAASPSVALDVNNLFFDISQELVGRHADGKGGFDQSPSKPHFALLIETESIDRKNSVYFGFGNGQFSQTQQNIGTDTENETREDDNLTYAALDTVAFKNMPFKTYYSGSDGFDKAKMYAEVFGGYADPTSSTTPAPDKEGTN